MITCVVEYVIAPAKIDAFERFARRWIELVGSHGGLHHGYFLTGRGCQRQGPGVVQLPQPRCLRAIPRPVRYRPGLHRGGPHQGRERLRAALRTDLHAAAASRVPGRISSPPGSSPTRSGAPEVVRRSGTPGHRGGETVLAGAHPDPAGCPRASCGRAYPTACPGRSAFKGKFPIFSAKSIIWPAGLP
jgi:hypothetical protein